MRFGSIVLNANVYVFVIVGSFLGCAMLFGEARLKRIAMALLAGLFAADQLSGFVGVQLGHAGFKSVDTAIIKLAILGLVTLALSLGKAPSVGGRLSLRTLILALTSAATLIAYTSSYLGVGAQTELTMEYNLVAIATDNRSWWLIGMLLWLIILQVWKKKSSDDEDGKKGKKKKK